MRPLAAALGLALALAGGRADAVDISPTRNAPDLASARARIKAEDFKGAAAELSSMVERGVQHADLYNLLAYSLRRSGELKGAATYYAKALEFDPAHRGALEYQGELFVQTGQIDRARRNAAILARLCPSGCEEREDLDRVIAGQGAKTP